MKGNSRPFIVEIKNRRRTPVRSRSIWGDLDLSMVAAETMTHEVEVAAPTLVDTNAAHVDFEKVHQPVAERSMADIKEADTGAEVASEQAPDAKKKPRQSRKSGPISKQSPETRAKKATAAQAAPSDLAKARRKTYSDKERAQKLQQIAAAIAGGTSSKDAVAQAGISEQTYYHWKRSAAPVEEGGDLKDLVALEEENERLKKLLAERLRKENADLKKKLGLT